MASCFRYPVAPSRQLPQVARILRYTKSGTKSHSPFSQDLLKAGATEQLAKKRAQRHGYRIDYDKLVTPDHDEESVKNEFSRLYDAGELPKDIATGYERTKEYEEKMTGNPNVSRAQARATKRAEQKAARRVAHANAAAGGSGSGQATAASNASGSQAGGGFGGGSTAPFGGGSAARNAGSAAPFGAAANALVPGGNGGAALFNGGPDGTWSSHQILSYRHH